MTNVALFVVIGFLIGAVIGFAIGHSQPKPNQGVGLGSFLKDAAAVAAAL
jgi:hypothetical protein